MSSFQPHGLPAASQRWSFSPGGTAKGGGGGTTQRSLTPTSSTPLIYALPDFVAIHQRAFGFHAKNELARHQIRHVTCSPALHVKVKEEGGKGGGWEWKGGGPFSDEPAGDRKNWVRGDMFLHNPTRFPLFP